ncbi:MAG: tetratricopeptide repeat protein [Proteobacteria bacterium]|nr:tetratricopeptide repeat protein [Pseudomonadota bacterium]
MRYRCVSCDETFESDDDEKVRCPTCLRVHGIEPAAVPPAPRRPAWVIPTAALGVASVVAAGVFFFGGTKSSVPAEVPLRPLDAVELEQYLQQHEVPSGNSGVKLLRPSEELRDFAREKLGRLGSAAEKASRISALMRDARERGSYARWPLVDPLASGPRSAAKILAAIQSDDGDRLYPLEVAALAAVALRSEGVKAMLAEVYAFPGDKSPPDPSGRFGYFVLAVRDAAKGKLSLFDPYGGRKQMPGPEAYDVRSDLEVVGVAFGIAALRALVHGQDPSKALSNSQQAVKLAPRSPAARSARAAVLLAAGGGETADDELRAALQLRPDPARRHNVAAVYLAAGDLERAMRELATTLEQAPDYASAHATLAAVHLSRGERDEAATELRQAERLEPDLPGLPLLWSQYYLRAGDTDRAISHAQRAVERRGHDPQARLVLGSIYRQAGKFEEMRAQARQVMRMTPVSRQTDTRHVIEQLLGPTALDEPTEPEDSREPADSTAPESRSLGQVGIEPAVGMDPAAGADGMDPEVGTDPAAEMQPGTRLQGGSLLLGGAKAKRRPSLLGSSRRLRLDDQAASREPR